MALMSIGSGLRRDRLHGEPGTSQLDRQIITYGAMHATHDPRKGYRELLAAIEKLKDAGQAAKLLLVVFGDLSPGDMPDLGIESRNVGYINDDQRLSLLYSAADVAAVPSKEEAFGKTLIEAMACATPVVAFDSGGPRDIITHRHDGYLAEPYSADDLAAGIAWCLDQAKSGAGLGLRARAKVESKFDIDVVAASYERLYRRILAEAQRPGKHNAERSLDSFKGGRDEKALNAGFTCR